MHHDGEQVGAVATEVEQSACAVLDGVGQPWQPLWSNADLLWTLMTIVHNHFPYRPERAVSNELERLRVAAVPRGLVVHQHWNLVATRSLSVIAERLKGVQIECDDAYRVLARYDTPHTLFYVDPPYPASTRGERWATTGYAHELTDAGHRWLADALKALKGMVVLSGFSTMLATPCCAAATITRRWSWMVVYTRTASGLTVRNVSSRSV